jgi:uncharacterized membrane protein required for colicin V production
MNAYYVDAAFVVLAALLAFQGYRKGFVRMAGSLIGLAISATIATWGITWFENATGWALSSNPITFVIVFLIATLICTKLVGLLIGLLDLVRKIFAIVPGVNLVNSLLGIVVGVAEAALVALAVAFATVNFFPAGVVRTALLESKTISTAVDYLVKANVL